MPSKAHALLKTKPVIAIYDQLLDALKDFGAVKAQVKKTSIHLVNKTGFAGVHPRKDYLLLEIKTDRRLVHPRILKAEQVSANRFHLTVNLASPKEVDAELLGWLRNAYEMSG